MNHTHISNCVAAIVVSSPIPAALLTELVTNDTTERPVAVLVVNAVRISNAADDASEVAEHNELVDDLAREEPEVVNTDRRAFRPVTWIKGVGLVRA